MYVLVIANPAAGRGRGGRDARKLCCALEKRGVRTELAITANHGHAARLASETDADVLAAVGGDGTSNEVINGIGNREIPLGVLPCGTVNVVAGEFGLPRDPEKAAAVIAGGQTRRIDLGEINGQRFLFGAGAGFDGAVAEKACHYRTGKCTLWDWVRAVTRTGLTYSFPGVRVTADGKAVDRPAQYAVTGNFRYSAGLFPLTPKAVYDDGLLDVCLLHDFSFLKMVHFLGAVWSPAFLERKDVTWLRAREITLAPEDDEAVPLQVDGDAAGLIPAAVRVLPAAASILVPETA
jgi:diacylglycerol kinase (ATP)